MKSRVLDIKVTMIAALLSFNVFAFGQEKTESDYPFFYGYDSNTAHSGPQASDIKPILLYPWQDEMTIRKRSDVEQETMETLIKTYLPDASIEWFSGWFIQDPSDVCVVTTKSEGLEEARLSLLKEDCVLSANRNYTRKVYKDLMDVYPVSKIATYRITGDVFFSYIDYGGNKEEKELADSLISSMIKSKGLTLSYSDNYEGLLSVPKNLDLLSVANQLYESGHFLQVAPASFIREKQLSVQPIDKSTLLDDDDIKMIEINDRFMVMVNPSTQKTEMESVIKSHVENSDIIWDNDSTITVITNPELVEPAMESLIQENAVLGISRKYFYFEEYERSLREGLHDPHEFGIDGIDIYFKNDVTDSAKDSLMNEHNLRQIYTRSYVYDVYSQCAVPKTLDMFSYCKSLCESISESEYVNRVFMHTTWAPTVIFWGSGSTTNVKTTPVQTQETGVQYYDLLGRRIDAPSGLTIEVKRYSDGTVRTQKILFK